MKVVHIATAFPRHEGDIITPWLGELVVAQRAAGLDASVLAPAYRGGGATSWRGVPVRRFRYAPRRLETLTHDETVPDRIRSRPGYAALLPAYMLGGSVAGVRVGTGRPDVVHVHWPFPHAWFGAVARAVAGRSTALVSSFYSVELRWVTRRMPALAPFLRWSIETSDAVTAISSSTAREVRSIAARRVPVIPFAAAAGAGTRDRPPARRARDQGPFTILFVGRLVERKGVDVLVRALGRLSEMPDVQLVVAGEGPCAARIRAVAEEVGVADRVRLLGRVDDAALEAAYRMADVFVLPAVVDEKGDTEGLGVVLLEALGFGVPVIGSDAGGIPDIIRGGDTGWLVPPGDSEALARAIREVVTDPEEAVRRVARGRDLAETRFSMPGIVRDLAICYERARAVRRTGRAQRAS